MSDIDEIAEKTSARLEELDKEFTRWLFKGQGPHVEYEPRVGDVRTRLAAAQEKVEELTTADEQRRTEIQQELAADIRYLEDELLLAREELEGRSDREE